VSWFAKLTIQDQSGDTISLTAPTPFHRNHIATQYDADLLIAFQGIRSCIVAVHIIVAGREGI